MSLESIDKEFIGQKLLSMGFPTWFRYMFRIIEDKPFIMEPIHDELLQVFDDIYNQKLTRINLNMPPRVAKTTLAKYFICFCLTKNSKCNFIYTSYSQLLLNGISKEIANILEHPVYKAMYPQKIEIKEQELNPVDDFWKAYLLQDQKENKYTARLIITAKGGQVLFASIGSSITGFGAGIRGGKGFTGGLVCFPYYERVWTDKGKMKIGDIVENKINVNVYSYNFKRKQVELQPIKNYIKNGGDDLVRVTLKNGASFECTKNHKVWTVNRGYVEAKDLIGGIDVVISFSNSLNSSATNYISKIRNFISPFITGYVFIDNVCFTNHVKNSYCITVDNNHNLFIGKNQGVLVSNCDDANKPADIHSSVMREKVVRYFEETLLSRLNNPDVAILNIQQRLHLEDLSGVLKNKYNYTTISKPLIIDGKCQLPRQYTEERIKELQTNNYMFQAQYQQSPIVYGGGVFKHEWWKYYSTIEVSYKRLFMTADTAMKTNEWNDYTAIGVWGLTLDNKLYLLDLLHGKYEAPELESNFLALFEKWRHGIKGKSLSSVFIEDKASGTGLIQSLKRKGGLPIRPITPEKDKLSRALDIVGYIASGNVYLPENDNNKISHEVLSETDAFSSDMSHSHDDIVDMIAYAVQQAYMKKGMF